MRMPLLHGVPYAELNNTQLFLVELTVKSLL